MAARSQFPGGTTLPCFLLHESSRTCAGIGEVPSRLWSRGCVDSRSYESGDHDPISFVSRDSLPLSSPGSPLSVRNCRCGHPLDFSGHHRAVCARARVRTNMLVRDMDLDVPVSDGRRLEVCNVSGVGPEPSWWSWEWRSAEDGRMRHALS